MTLVVWTNLALDNQYTAERLTLKVLDQIYTLSPRAPQPPTEVAP